MASTLAAQRIVSPLTSTSGAVGYPASASFLPVGITVDTVKDINEAIPVATNGIAKLYFNDTCPAMGLVASDSSGRGVPHTNVTAGSYIVGQLLDGAVSATGTVARVLIQPIFKSIP